MNLKKALKVALKAGRKAAKIQKKNYGKNHEHKMKNGYDYATQSDLDSEKVILETLKKYYPNHKYVAEESKNSDEDLQAEYCWVIDPLDGTHCFANEIPFFAPSIALLHKGAPVVAVIIFPALDEEYTAIAGEGTKLNGKLIRIKQASKIKGAHVTIGAMHAMHDKFKKSFDTDFASSALFPATTSMMRQVVKGNSAVAYGYAWMVWDEAGADLIVREAGGKVATQKNKPIEYKKADCRYQGIKIYTNPRAFKNAQSYLKK